MELLVTTDLHKGSRHHMTEQAKKHRDWVADGPDRYTIDLGDATENGTRTSVGDAVYEQTMSPEEQLEAVVEYYRPLKGKVLGVCRGNHGKRTQNASGIDPDKWLAREMGCPYIMNEKVLALTVGDSRWGHQYLVFARHKICNASTPQGVIAAMTKNLGRIPGCDVYLFGHTHSYVYHSQAAMVPDPRHDRCRKIEQHMVTSGSFLEYEDSYAEECPFGIPTDGMALVRLWKTERKVEVERLWL